MLTPPRRSAPTLATSGRRGRIDRPVQAFLEPARALDSQPAAQVLEIGVVVLSKIPKSRTRLTGSTTSFSHPRRYERPRRRGYHHDEPAAEDYHGDQSREINSEVEFSCKRRHRSTCERCHGGHGAPREVCAVRCTFRAPRPGAGDPPRASRTRARVELPSGDFVARFHSPSCGVAVASNSIHSVAHSLYRKTMS